MALPPTYFEFVKKLRPLLVEMAEQDAADLLNGPKPPQAIHSVDDFNSRFGAYFERLNADVLGYGAEHPGVSTEEMSPFLSSAPPQTKTFLAGLYGTVNMEYHSVLNFALAGKKTFHFSDNLVEHLANTEINVKAALIQLPFPTCQFTFTARAAINAMHNIRGQAGRLDINAAGLDYSAPISVFLTVHPTDDELRGRKLIIKAWHARLPNTSYLALKRELYLGDNWTLEQALRTDWGTLTPNDLGSGLSVDAEGASVGLQADDRFYTDGLAFYRIVLNAVLYLSSEQAELANEVNAHQEIEVQALNIASLQKRRKLLQTRGRFSSLNYREVGASVGPIVIQKNAADSGLSGAGGGKPLVRFMVRGHWRKQASGPESLERKLIWIRPHFKGPDLATTINKPYLVK